ncbi:hypothetical protein EDD11_005046 [Mortierella claussenii]|nr:hypothetical protein EDD11_005046 [Mortierella claussenii]
MPIFRKFNLDKQAVEVPGTQTPGATGHYRHSAFADGLVDHIRESPNVKTLYDIFQHAVATYQHKDFLGHRPWDPMTCAYGRYTWESYVQINERVNAFGSGLMHLNESILGNSQLTRWTLGLWAQGRPEWFISEMSCNFFNLISVPLYDTLGPDAIEYVCNHAEIRIVVCSANHVLTLLKNADKLPKLKAIISMASPHEGTATAPGSTDALSITRSWATEKDIKFYDFDEMEALGRAFPRKHMPPQSDEVATLSYTSGTTGQPKGAMLTHRNFIANIGGNREGMRLTTDDVVISYLPLAHVMGRATDANATFAGSKIGYFHGDMQALMDDVAELKPTYFPTVPRLLNRIYAKVVASTIDAPGVMGALSRHAIAVKLANLETGKGVHHPFWDRLLFNNIKMILGGRVEVLLTGSAPISKEVLNFLRVVFGCVVVEGEYIAGHVGCPRPNVEIRLVDVPEMNYFATDMPFPRGEIQVRGAVIFKGYYKDEENTREAKDAEGWLATGDIGLMDNRGCLTIIDRKKNIFKLAQGEYIAPEKIENTLTARCNLIMQIYVHGDSLESTLVAVAVPDPETFLPFANSIVEGHGGKIVTLADKEGLDRLLEDPKVKAAYVKELERAGRAGGLKGFELVKRVHLTMDAFSVGNGMITPTFKVRRPQVRDYFKEPIRAMYEEMRSVSSAAVAKL